MIKILIIDNSPDRIDYLTSILKTITRCTIIRFTNSQQGLNWIHKNDFDLLIINPDMPEMNGLDFIRHSRGGSKEQGVPDNTQPPILLMVPSEQRASLLSALEVGITDCLPYPFEALETQVRLQSVLAYRFLQIRFKKQQKHFSKKLQQMTSILAKERERYALAAQAANDGLWDWDLIRNEVYYSPQWCAMIGLRSVEVTNTLSAWLSRVHPDDLEELDRALQAYIAGETKSFSWEYRMRHRNGFYHWMVARAIAVYDKAHDKVHDNVHDKTHDNTHDKAPKPIRLVGLQIDISERKRVEEQLIHHAFHDALTGLPNRSLVNERLQQEFLRFKRDATQRFAVMFLDLDHFKDINDSLGHAAGDQILLAIAPRLKKCCREVDTVARLAGDEFIILLSEVPSLTMAKRIATRLLTEVAKPVHVAGETLSPSLSIGIAFSHEDHKSFTDVLRDADTALYKAKSQGRSCFVIFDPARDGAQHESADSTMVMTEALDRGQICVFYQPIFHLDTLEIGGFEALVRWQHPRFGLLMPDDFFPLAEENHTLIEFSTYIFENAIKQLKVWQDLHRKQYFMCINISEKQLLQNGLIEYLKASVKKGNIDPQTVILEVREADLLGSLELVEHILERLHSLGYQLLLDNFGAGQASLRVLSSLPLDALKIDRSITTTASTDVKAQNILRLAQLFAAEQNIKMILEGIETGKELDFVRAHYKGYAQGFYLAFPAEAEQIEPLLHMDHQKRLMTTSESHF
jgi:diguanylate cyclase (GGDEF)-like protein/PAS domain S-box-containing protein